MEKLGTGRLSPYFHMCRRIHTQVTEKISTSHCSSMEKAMAPHSNTLAWKIPWVEQPGRLQSMGLLRVGHDWATSLSHPSSKRLFPPLQPLEEFAFSARKLKWKWKSLSRVWLLVTPWTAAYQAAPPMGFSRQEYQSEVPLPSPNCISILHKMFSFTK